MQKLVLVIILCLILSVKPSAPTKGLLIDNTVSEYLLIKVEENSEEIFQEKFDNKENDEIHSDNRVLQQTLTQGATDIALETLKKLVNDVLYPLLRNVLIQGLSLEGNILFGALENNSGSVLTLAGAWLIHGEWLGELPADFLYPGQRTTWVAQKRAFFYGTTAVIVYTDGTLYYMFGATHPRSLQSETAVASNNYLFADEDAAHDAYDSAKTTNSVTVEPYVRVRMAREPQNEAVTVLFNFTGFAPPPLPDVAPLDPTQHPESDKEEELIVKAIEEEEEDYNEEWCTWNCMEQESLILAEEEAEFYS